MTAKQQTFTDILTSEFNTEKFLRFSKEFFVNLDIIRPDKLMNDYWNWSEFSFHIEGFYHIANFTGNDKAKIAVFAVKLKDHKTIDRARSMQRNFVKKLMSSSGVDGAIVAFFADGDTKWRLSFVKLDFEFAGGKVTEKITPAKRYSFLVGAGEPCHTAMERLYPIFINEISNPNIAEIEAAFSVEAVTKQFFEDYKEKYIELKEHLESNSDFISEANRLHFTSEQFAKKLMGQLAFLYFIQKKGWLGVNAFPKTLTKKQYDNAFYERGKASREVLPKAFKHIAEDEYRLAVSEVENLTKDEQETLASAVRGQPWGTGPKNFIRKLFEVCDDKGKDNFFDEYLEPLFYEALNEKRGAADYYYKLKCRVPFLNGGLFEPLENYDWSNNKFAIPNEMFSNKKTKDEYSANGILDVFDRYNFTMNEDEPLEKEVAVDPEMLGKIFENLLDVKDRKSKGAFYTPREIVHYMCQESLVNYLVNETCISYDAIKDFIVYGEFMRDEDTTREAKQGIGELYISNEILDTKNGVNRLKDIDDALANIRVADPAVGSGAFPLGMVSEIVKARRNLTEYFGLFLNDYQKRMLHEVDRHPLNLKLHTIKNSIFAVDIEPSAVDITKLRLWLSLVVEQETDESATDDGIKAVTRNPRSLPNLDCNIRCGNSLIDELDGVKLINESELFGKGKDAQIIWGQNQYDSLLNDLFDAQDKLFYESNHQNKAALQKKIRAIIDRIIMTSLGEAKDEIIEKYNETKTQASLPYFLWQLEFAKVFKEKGGFDVVVGNPPYVGEKGHKEIFEPINKSTLGKSFHCFRMDLFYYFFHQSINLAKKEGLVAFITTNYYITATGGVLLRKDFRERTTIKNLINFNELRIFESALGQHNMITILSKSFNENNYANILTTSKVGFADSSLLNSILHENSKKSSKKQIQQKDLFDGKNNYIRLQGNDSSGSEDDKSSLTLIINKILNRTILLGEICDVRQGIISGADKVTNLHLKKYDLPSSVKGDGIFVLTVDEMNSIYNVDKCTILKPWFKNSDISRYYTKSQNLLYVIYSNDEITLFDKEIIRGYLSKFQPILLGRGMSYDWCYLHRSREKRVFESPKIVTSQRVSRNSFGYNEISWYSSADVYYIINPHPNFELKYILALLNSKLFYIWLFNRGKRKGNLLELYQQPLSEIPIRIIALEEQKPFVGLVDQILAKKQEDSNADTLAIETQIDKMVNELYGLTDDEIKIVEASTK